MKAAKAATTVASSAFFMADILSQRLHRNTSTSCIYTTAPKMELWCLCREHYYVYHVITLWKLEIKGVFQTAIPIIPVETYYQPTDMSHFPNHFQCVSAMFKIKYITPKKENKQLTYSIIMQNQDVTCVTCIFLWSGKQSMTWVMQTSYISK